MQNSSVQLSLPFLNVIERFAGNVRLAAENADLDNWLWNSRDGWVEAEDIWQHFKARWYGATDSQCTSLIDPKSPSLLLEPLPHAVDPSVSSSVFMRKSYVTMFDRVWARAMASEGDNRVIITGQPGTGKTLFKYYLLVQLLRYKQVVLFSLDGKELFLFYHDKVYVAEVATIQLQRGARLPKPKSPSSKVFIWSLLDIQEQKEPKMFMVRQPCLPVQTSSPDPFRYKTWDKERTPMLTGLPLWTRDELTKGNILANLAFLTTSDHTLHRLPYQKKYHSLLDTLRKVYGGSSLDQSDPLDIFPGACALLQEHYSEEDIASLSPEDALDYLLEAAIDRFGYSARDVFGAVFDYKATTQRHQDAFRIKYTDLQAAVSALPNNQSADHSITHQILALCPVYRGPLGRVGWTVNFKSDWVARSVIRELGEAEDIAICQKITFFRSILQAAVLAERFLELLAHCSIAETSTGGFWPLISLTYNGTDPPHFTMVRDALSSVSNDVQFAKIKRKIIKLQSIADLSTCLKNNMYYIPADPNFLLFDAFTIDLDYLKKSAVLWVLQITTSRLHGGSGLGYLKICNIITSLKNHFGDVGEPPCKIQKQADGQTSSKLHVEVRYLLVLLQGDSRNQWHFLKGWNENWKRNDHRSNVYCLGVPITVSDNNSHDVASD